MKRFRVALRAVVFLLIVSLVSGVSSTQVSATESVEMTFTFEDQIVEGARFEELPGGLTKVTVDSVRYSIAGDWVGHWVHSVTGTVGVGGVAFFQGFATFTGTIAGRVGTLEIRIHTHGIWSDFPFGPFQLRFSKLTIISGTGDLSNAHGHGVEERDFFVRVWVNFDP